MNRGIIGLFYLGVKGKRLGFIVHPPSPLRQAQGYGGQAVQGLRLEMQKNNDEHLASGN
jgi:hypothetical protein